MSFITVTPETRLSSEETIELPPRFSLESSERYDQFFEQKLGSVPPLEPLLSGHGYDQLGLDGHESSTTTRRIESRNPFVPAYNIELPIYHYCARCGRRRSKRFQRKHPLRAGDAAIVEVCKKCRQGPGPDPPQRKQPATPIYNVQAKNGAPAYSLPRSTKRLPRDTEVEEIIIRKGRGQPPFRNDSARSGTRTRSARRRDSSSNEKYDRTFKTPIRSDPRRARRVIHRVASLSNRKRVTTQRYRLERSSSNEQLTVFHSNRETYDESPRKIRITVPSVSSEGSNDRTGAVVTYRQERDSPAVLGAAGAEVSNQRKSDSREKWRNSTLLDAMDRVDSHPNAWGYRIVTRIDDAEEPVSRDRCCPTKGESPNDDSTEWYYKRFSRSTEPSYVDPFKACIQSDSPPQCPDPPISPMRRALSPDGVRYGRGILQYPRRETPKDLYDAEYGQNDPCRDCTVDDDVLRGDTRHVRFTPSTKGEATAKRQREAYGDWQEAKKDQRTYDKAKSKIGKTLHKKGAGPLDLDGNASEDYTVSEDSTEVVDSNGPYETEAVTTFYEKQIERCHSVPYQTRSRSALYTRSTTTCETATPDANLPSLCREELLNTVIRKPCGARAWPWRTDAPSQSSLRSSNATSSQIPHPTTRFLRALHSDTSRAGHLDRAAQGERHSSRTRQRSSSGHRGALIGATVIDGNGVHQSGTWEAEAHVTQESAVWQGEFPLRRRAGSGSWDSSMKKGRGTPKTRVRR